MSLIGQQEILKLSHLVFSYLTLGFFYPEPVTVGKGMKSTLWLSLRFLFYLCNVRVELILSKVSGGLAEKQQNTVK